MKVATFGLAFLAAIAALSPVHAAAGNAQLLTDAELDAVSAQGLFVVNLSFGFSRIAGRFDFGFTAQTTIETADVTGGGGVGHAEVGFLGGLLSISTTPGSRPAVGTETPRAAGVATSPAGPGALISVTARQATVHTRANLFVSASDAARSAARAVLMRHIPRTLGGR